MVPDPRDNDCGGLLQLLDSLCDGGADVAAVDAFRLDSVVTTATVAAGDIEACDVDDDDGELLPLVELMSSDDIEHDLGSHGAFGRHDVAAVAAQSAMPHLQSLGLPDPVVHDSKSAGTTSTIALSSSAKRLGKQPRSSKKPSANKARDERKSELIYLRKKVSELEARLSSVLANRPRITAASHDSVAEPAVSAAQSSSEGVASVWRDIAHRQREERAHAERENVRLKLVLENQLKVAKSLEKILNKKSTTKDMQAFAERSGSVRAPAATDVSDADEFEALLQYVEQMYLDIDSVFHENGLAHTETPMSSAEMRASVQRGMFLEICANKVLPFDIFATGDAVWHHFAVAKEHTPFRFYTYTSSKLRSTEDTIMESFVLKLDAKGTDANFRVKQVLRRHIEAHRVVVVWRAAFEAFEFSDEPVSGMRYHENGYIVIKKPSQVAGDYSLLQTCYITTPNFPQDLSVITNPRVGAISDFVLAATAANVSSTHQMIENVLLEQALKRSGRLLATS